MLNTSVGVKHDNGIGIFNLFFFYPPKRFYVEISADYAGTTIVENDADCYMEVSAGGGDALRTKKLALLLGD